MPVRPRAVVVAVFVAAGALVLGAQQPLFRAAVEHVSLDVVVTDEHDRLITDLTKSDFTVVENGVRQEILEFDRVSPPPVDAGFTLKGAQPPPSDVSTNTFAPTSRAIMFLIDDLSIRLSDLSRVKDVMTEALKALSPDDVVAISYLRRSDLGQDFTSDMERLVKSVNNIKGAFGIGSRVRPFDNVQNAVQALAAASQRRKALVLVSAGMVGDPPPPEWIDLLDNARRHDLPIYVIDPHGLLDSGRMGARQFGSQDIAAMTGGLAFFNQQDVTAATRRLMSDTGTYYLLGYAPAPLVRDGKFHDVKVTVDRPGARVRARSGYTAPDEAPVALDPKTALNDAIGSGFDSTGLALRAFAAPLGAAPKGMRTVVTLDVTYPRLAAPNAAFSDSLDLSIVALDPDGKIKAELRRPIHIDASLSPENAPSFLINQVMDLPSKTFTLRVGATSETFARTGTTHLVVTVPDPSDDKLQLGGLVLGATTSRQGFAIRADPITALAPFQPTTLRTFAPTEILRVFARCFWGSKQPVPDVAISVKRDGALIVGKPPAMTAAGNALGKFEATATASLPLKGLAPGGYTVDVVARLTNGQTAERVVPFTVK
jgi:VWFA-related protein